jgi:hypothetical protein
MEQPSTPDLDAMPRVRIPASSSTVVIEATSPCSFVIDVERSESEWPADALDRLAEHIMTRFPLEIRDGECAVDCAIRLLGRLPLPLPKSIIVVDDAAEALDLYRTLRARATGVCCESAWNVPGVYVSVAGDPRRWLFTPSAVQALNAVGWNP